MVTTYQKALLLTLAQLDHFLYLDRRILHRPMA